MGGSASGGDGSGGELPTCDPNTGNQNDGDANIDFDTEYQVIRGFGGVNMVGGPGIPSWETIFDMPPEAVDTAFGVDDGDLGLTILRIRVPYDQTKWQDEVATAKRASDLGAIVFATPWSPPTSMKSNGSLVGGELMESAYGTYADFLVAFRDYMQEQGVPIYAISVQNEPDIAVSYESCDWTSGQIVDFLSSQGSRFGDTKLIAAESFNFNHSITDPILNSATAEPQVDIIGGHIYGGGLADYPLARNKGKEVWMTEHFTESSNDGNVWPLALDVAKELNDSMKANFNAYVWWYIRRSYGLINDDNQVTKRGYLMSQYSRFVRPGAVRIGATNPSANDVHVTAYKHDGKLVVVAVNLSSQQQDITLDLFGGCVQGFAKYTTSGTKSAANEGDTTVSDNKAAVKLDGQSATTFVSY